MRLNLTNDIEYNMCILCCTSKQIACENLLKDDISFILDDQLVYDLFGKHKKIIYMTIDFWKKNPKYIT